MLIYNYVNGSKLPIVIGNNGELVEIFDVVFCVAGPTLCLRYLSNVSLTYPFSYHL